MPMIPDLINHRFALRDMGYSNAMGSSALPRHRWYFVKEAFSPEIVKAAIEQSGCGPDDIIVDPFSGSGTVPVAAVQAGRHSVAFEVNPFLAFVSRAKLAQTSQDLLEVAACSAIEAGRRGKPSSLEAVSSFGPAGGRPKWLFNTEVLRAFAGSWSATADWSGPVQDMCRLALLGAALDNCNAFRDGKCLRYRKDWGTCGFGRDSFLQAFGERVLHIHTDLAGTPIDPGMGNIILGDCRWLLGHGLRRPFKLCVTSPPYLNSFDYSDVYRPELFLGGFVDSNAGLRNIRLNTVRSHVQAAWRAPTESDFGELYSQSVARISERSEFLWSRQIPLMVQAYFEDLSRVLKELRENALPSASLWLVVSTSAYVGVQIPVDLIIAEIGSRVGWRLQEVGVLRYLRPASHHWHKHFGIDSDARLRESVVIFSAC